MLFQGVSRCLILFHGHKTGAMRTACYCQYYSVMVLLLSSDQMYKSDNEFKSTKLRKHVLFSISIRSEDRRMQEICRRWKIDNHHILVMYTCVFNANERGHHGCVRFNDVIIDLIAKIASFPSISSANEKLVSLPSSIALQLLTWSLTDSEYQSKNGYSCGSTAECWCRIEFEAIFVYTHNTTILRVIRLMGFDSFFLVTLIEFEAMFVYTHNRTKLHVIRLMGFGSFS